MTAIGEISLGSATTQPGTIQYGLFEAFAHPTGGVETFPVILAQGQSPGPCLWLTAGIHGPEHSGPLIIYNLLDQELISQLKGTIVAIPALNPAGLRTRRREPYHAPGDPNRLWPDGRPLKPPDPDKDPPSSLEFAYQSLFQEIQNSADFLIDYHNAWTGSLPFVFRDRVLYDDHQEAQKNKSLAEALSARLDEMIQAFGFTVINEFPVEKYLDAKLHRSTSGAALLVGRIPAFTVELGTGYMPDRSIQTAALAGTRNVMRWAGMLEGDLEPVEGIPIIQPGFAVRRRSTPRVPEACVVEHRVEAGDRVAVGDLIANLYDIWGRPLKNPQLLSEEDGFVMGRAHGIYHYPGSAVTYMAIRDEESLVGPYPESFFDDEKENT